MIESFPISSGIIQAPLEGDFSLSAQQPNRQPTLSLNLPLGIPNEKAIEIIADKVTCLTDQQLPVNIDTLLPRFGINDVIYQEKVILDNGSSVTGLIQERNGGDFIIRMRSGLSVWEAAFTKGHELGHRILHDVGFPISRYGEIFEIDHLEANDPEYLNRIILRSKIEVFCDDFSRRVLAPRHLFLPRIEQLPRDWMGVDTRINRWRIVPELARLLDDTQLSAWAFNTRLHDLGLWRESLRRLQGMLGLYLEGKDVIRYE